MQLGGMEHSIPAVGAHGERLGSILESIRRRLNALVADLQRVPLLGQDKMSVGAAALDGIGCYIPGNPQVAGIGFVAHGLQLADSDVVALIRLCAGDREIGDGAKDNYGCGADADCLRTDAHCYCKGRSVGRFRQAQHLNV